MGLTPGKVLASPNVEEVLVRGMMDERDPSQISADAESLLMTAGAVGDPMRAALSLPGITFGNDDLDAPAVRGAGPDDNVFIVDDIPLPYMFHWLGDSILPSNVVRTFDVHKSVPPIEFSDVSGGVFDIGLRAPRRDGHSGTIDLSELKSGFLVEGGNDEQSAYLSYRYNLMHIFLTEFEDDGGPTIYKMPKGYDYTGRYQWQGNNNTITLTAIGAEDTQKIIMKEWAESDHPLDEQQATSFNSFGLQWEKHGENGSLFSATLSHTNTKDEHAYFGSWDFYENLYEQNSYLRSFLQLQNDNNQYTIGVNIDLINAEFKQNGWIEICDDFRNVCSYHLGGTEYEQSKNITQSSIYAENQWKINENWRFDYGFHYAQDSYLNEDYPEIRFGLSYQPGEKHQFYINAGQYHQQIKRENLFIFDNVGPLKAEKSDQLALGHIWDINRDWSFQSELYYKSIHNLLLIEQNSVSNQLEGTVTGAEFMLAKRMNSTWFGWLSLSLENSNRKNKITGEVADYKYGTPFSLNWTNNVRFGRGWTFGLNYTYQSGAYYTPATGIEQTGTDPNSAISYNIIYGDINSRQLGNYGRLDIRLQKESVHSFGTFEYYIDILNIFDKWNDTKRKYYVSISDGEGTYVEETNGGIPLYIALGLGFSF